MKDEIFRLHRIGYSYGEIQKELGCSKGTISYHLGLGQKEKTLTRNKDKRNKIRKYIQECKTGKACIDCKEDYPYWIMDFDHLENKSFNVSSFYNSTLSIEKVVEEIAKCEIVCSNCHRNRTFNRKISSGNSVSLI